MGCCHYYAGGAGHESVFRVDASAIKFGPGAIAEVGDDARRCGMRRAALFTDPGVAALALFAEARAALAAAGVDAVVYEQVEVEPTDRSFQEAARFARAGGFDGFISIGGGSVMDTAKAAALYTAHPAPFMDYVNAPLGAGRAPPGPLPPHIACPTTAGTGSECTGIAVFDLLEQRVKTGIAAPVLRPTQAVIDPRFAESLPPMVVACSGFDVLSHALESWTARPYTKRPRPDTPGARPMSQGANPWSDMGCREALRLTGALLERAVCDGDDREARHGMMFAAALAGIAFGNSGVHIPHGMSYSVAGLVRDFRPDGYAGDGALCPHGMSVIVNAPAAFRFTAPACPQRHLEGARLLGAEVRDAAPEDSGALVAGRLLELMRATGMPNGIGALGYGDGDLPALAAGAFAQQRLLTQAPRPVGLDELQQLYGAAAHYW